MRHHGTTMNNTEQTENSSANRIMRILILIVACLLPLANATAEHEADHRYNVRGYIVDADDNAIAGRKVTIFADGEMLASGKTDSSGY